jgi:hypothetical protein
MLAGRDPTSRRPPSPPKCGEEVAIDVDPACEPEAPRDPLDQHALVVASHMLAQVDEDHARSVLDLLRLVAAAVGGKLRGLAHHKKSLRSLTRKLADRARMNVMADDDIAGAIASVAERTFDAIRFTLVVPEARYRRLGLELPGLLRDAGYTCVNRWDAWRQSDTYKGMHFAFRHGALTFELQLHTRASHKMVKRTRALYEALRDRATTPERKHALQDDMKRQWRRVPVPAGVDSAPRPWRRARDGGRGEAPTITERDHAV